MCDQPSDFTNLDQSLEIQADSSKYGFLNTLSISEDVVRRLSLHLDRLVKGSDEVFLTPIGKDHSPEVILEEFSLIFNNNLAKMNKTLVDLEMSNKSKYGPRSIAKPWKERKKSLQDYYSQSRSTESPIFSSNVKGSMRPIDFNEAMKLLKNNTNSGMPYYTRKSKIKEKTLEHLQYQLDQKYPCILFTRTQEGGKTRNVWGYPTVDTLNEMRFYSPLLKFQKRLAWRSALLGPDSVDRAVSQLMIRALTDKLKLLSIDFSSYDASISSSLQRQSFNYIKSLFQSAHSEDIDGLFHRFNEIGIITPDNIVYGQHGVPSGATFTNEVDSIVQYLIAREIKIDDTQLQIQGDDGVYAITDSQHDKLVTSFKHYGLNFNEEKSYISDEYLVYLQKLYHLDFLKHGFIGGIYPVYRALCRIVFQERYSNFEDFDIKGIDYYSLRTISILENCKYHPLFKELVEYIYRLDKYSLKFSNDSIKSYDRMANEGSGIGGLIINQYGDNIKGIYSFETIKLLRDLGWSS